MTKLFSDFDEWIAGHIEVDGFPLVVRARASLPDEALRNTYQHLICICWEYDANDAGLPKKSELPAIYEFEELVENYFNDGDTASLAAAVTGHGEKEWRYYTKSVEDFMQEFNELLSGQDKRPVTLQAFVDDEWNALQELQDSGT